jgi:hypothetical protein
MKLARTISLTMVGKRVQFDDEQQSSRESAPEMTAQVASITLICTMNMGTLGTAPLAIQIDEAQGTATIATTVCPLEKSSALKIVIRCESADGTMLTYVIDRLTGEIVAQSHAEQVTLTGKCKRTEKAL